MLVEHCNYGTLEDELVIHHIFVGILNEELSRELQEDDKLTLEKAVQRCRELVKRQRHELILLKILHPRVLRMCIH